MTDAELRVEIAALREDIRRIHTPLTCPVAEDVKKLSAFREQLRGAWKTLVILGGLAGAGLALLIEWFVGQR